MEVGQRNQEVKVLDQNWCGHARIEKFGGTGMIEAATGFPIGHHSMACDDAPSRRFATWHLEDAALEFYDSQLRELQSPSAVAPTQSCGSSCADETSRRAARVADQQREAKKLRDQAHARQEARAALQANATVPVSSLIDDLQHLDQTRAEPASGKDHRDRSPGTEKVFNADIVEYLLHLIEADESWAIETALCCLRMVSPDHKRLIACAMQCLSLGRSTNTAAEILIAHLDLVDASQVQPAVKSLCFLAAPPRSDFSYSEPEKRPEPLQALASRFPERVEKALEHHDC